MTSQTFYNYFGMLAISLQLSAALHIYPIRVEMLKLVSQKIFLPLNERVFYYLNINHYRNWPRYGLRWSGLCCHSRHSTSGAGRRVAACVRTGRPHECCAGSGSTNHDSADRMSGQFLFYHENEATQNDKSRDDHDLEPPCWNALAGKAIVMMEASIDTVPE